MSEGMVCLLVIIGILICQFFYTRRLRKKSIERKITEKYGKKPLLQEYDFQEIGIIWKEWFKESEETIDEITWNDLELDKLFARINNCSSFLGEQLLYVTLKMQGKNRISLKEQEKRIAYLNADDSQRINIQIKLAQLGKKDSSYYVARFIDEPILFKIEHGWIYKTLLILLGSTFFSGLMVQNVFLLCSAGVIFLLNLTVYVFMKGKYEINLDLMKTLEDILLTNKKIILSNKTEYGSHFYKCLSSRKGLSKLRHYLSFISNRQNAQFSLDAITLCATYLTGAFLLDFIVYNSVIAEIEKNREYIKALILELAETDLIISIESFRRSKKTWCLPQISTEQSIKGVGVYHPLLEEPVTNDVYIKNHCIITGSNASGKSTFIKALAINEILAQSIYTCTAEEMVLPQARVLTSMAIRDDLLQGESYFMKEIKSLNRIIEATKNKERLLVIVDEILRGTNTKERLAASAAILEYLQKQNCLVIVATHDFELLELLKSNNIDNFYFCEKTQNETLVFDFKIHKGVSEQTNAIKLLNQLGFPNLIVKNARDIYNQISTVNNC